MGHTLIGAVGDHDVLDFDVFELSDSQSVPRPVSTPVPQSVPRRPEPSRRDPALRTPSFPVDLDEEPETEFRAYGAHCRIAMHFQL
jgi:hypothetical protein